MIPCATAPSADVVQASELQAGPLHGVLRGGAAAALTHPLALVALGLLLLNDHVLKASMPGRLSGKLSDFCGVLLLPLWLTAGGEWVAARLGVISTVTPRRLLTANLALTALVFGGMQLLPAIEGLYTHGLGLARWPFRALGALGSGAALPPWAPVRSTADPTDLVALVMLPIAPWLAARSVVRRLSIQRGAAAPRPLESAP